MPQSPLLLGLWVAQPCDYRVEVQTGDVFNAGTNSKIMANVFGELALKALEFVQAGRCMAHDA